MEESALERARPDARIDLTRTYGYQQLLEQVKVHGYVVMQERGELLTSEEVAADWYDHVYLPTVDAIRSEDLAGLIPHAKKALERRVKPSRTRKAAGKLKQAAKRPIKAIGSPKHGASSSRDPQASDGQRSQERGPIIPLPRIGPKRHTENKSPDRPLPSNDSRRHTSGQVVLTNHPEAGTCLKKEDQCGPDPRHVSQL